jgi:hypothetical protein
MTAVCIPYHATGATTTDSPNGDNVPELATGAGDGRPVAVVTDPDGSVRKLIQDKEVTRNG